MSNYLSFAIGFVLALVVGVFARVIGLDRERGFYPIVTMIVGTFFVLFSCIAGSTTLLLVEIAICLVFIGLGVAGFKQSLWFAVVGLGGHGVFDLIHLHVVDHPGVPVWWPGFCSGYDIAAAAFLSGLLLRGAATPREA